MIDTRAVAQEVQDQLAAAVHKGHEQFRKGQEQIRKGRETVTVAVRTGSQFAQAVRPSLPKLPSVQLRLPSLTELASRDKVRASAQELGSQMLAGQRKLGGRALEVASPFITEGVAKLTEAAGALVASRRTGQREHAEPLENMAATAADPATVTEDGTAATAPPAEETPAVTGGTSPAKAAAKPRAARTTATAKSGTAKRPAAKSTGPAKAKGNAASSKPRSAKN